LTVAAAISLSFRRAHFVNLSMKRPTADSEFFWSEGLAGKWS